MSVQELFIKSLNTLLFSWGSDAPAEAVWTANDLKDFYSALNDKNYIINLEEDLSNVEDFINQFN